jgi:hypothetical protein
MSDQVVLAAPDSSPSTRCVFVSIAVNSTQPSPDAITLEEAAPAFQPAPAVLARVAPLTATPTSLVHTRLSTRKSWRTAPVVSKAESALRGYVGATVLV